jgi:hypothetical protein
MFRKEWNGFGPTLVTLTVSERRASLYWNNTLNIPWTEYKLFTQFGVQ